MKAPDSIIALLQKIKRLAAEGATPGERAAAQSQLELLLAKHGITLDQITDRETSIYWFRVKTKSDSQILHQVVAKLRAWEPTSYYTRKATPGKYGYKLTRLENAEVEIQYEHFKKAYAKDADLHFRAWISKQDLGAPITTVEEQSLESLLQMASLLSAINKTQPPRALLEAAR